jgi:predicted transcriptional regulator
MMPNLQALQVFYGTIPLIAIFLVAVWTNNKRLDDLRSDVNARIEQIGTRFADLEKRLSEKIDAMDKRVSEKIDALEKRLVERIERLEHPLVKG